MDKHRGPWATISGLLPHPCDSKRVKSGNATSVRSDLVQRNVAFGLPDCAILDRRGLNPFVHFHNLIDSAFASARILQATTYIRSDTYNEAYNHNGRSTGYD